jgi:DNA polymerase alpha subunit A
LQILTHTKELVERMGYQVIYGDTDSIMIDTKLYDVVEAKKRGLEVISPLIVPFMNTSLQIKKQVNKCHRHLELDVDGLYKRLLLLKKKKYAGLSVDLDDASGQRVKREMKGIDVVRRDWSQLAKDAGK